MLPLNVYKCCTSMCLQYSAAPENSRPQGHELHLDLFGQQEPVLLLDLSTYRGLCYSLICLHYRGRCWTCLHLGGQICSWNLVCTDLLLVPFCSHMLFPGHAPFPGRRRSPLHAGTKCMVGSKCGVSQWIFLCLLMQQIPPSCRISQ